MTGRVSQELRDLLRQLEGPLSKAGFLVAHVGVTDEGAWGRLDATIEGAEQDGKLQIHLSSKGRVSIVPQGPSAKAIATVLTQYGHAVANIPAAANHPAGAHNRVVAQTRSRERAPPATSRSAGCVGELVVDCSKFGRRLIGPTEWRGMLRFEPGTWREVFHSPRYERGHNNLGEFLAIVDACRRIERQEIACTSLWSDSQTAISWFTKGIIKTTIDINTQCDPAFANAVAEALAWLAKADRGRFTRMLSRWSVTLRGENPADFGRK
ncbi:MAG: hypothetical protein EXS03_02635 [Phycisphaerales bacterium]|nr:hypothetical protein [Phycisphaerales bacterium]